MERLLAAVGTEVEVPDWHLAGYLACGKRLRAQLVVAAAAFGEARPAVVGRYAAFVELMHAGSLCHDDVVDRSFERRNRPSVAAACGSGTATHVGLLLMMRAYGLVAGEHAEVRRAVGRAAARVAHGQAEEMADLYIETVRPAAYLRRIREKTAALFELGAWLGCRAGRVRRRIVRPLRRFARGVGVAFQLVDDLRDFDGGPMLGREAGTDLREGVYTLPVLLALAGRLGEPAPVRAALRAMRQSPSSEAFRHCRNLLACRGAFAVTQRIAERAFGRACEALDELPASPPREVLRGYARAVVAGGVGV
jgi:heptaprenyl diphosphate synthase